MEHWARQDLLVPEPQDPLEQMGLSAQQDRQELMDLLGQRDRPEQMAHWAQQALQVLMALLEPRVQQERTE